MVNLGPVTLPLILMVILAFSLPASAGGDRSADEALPRVEHHLRAAEQLAVHFEGVLAKECPHFETRAEWSAYFEDEVGRVVLLVAHLEQAWAEAKQTGDKDVRRAAKAPRAQVDRAQLLVTKLQGCAGDNGAGLAPSAIWRRVEREVPRRQSEIALPE